MTIRETRYDYEAMLTIRQTGETKPVIVSVRNWQTMSRDKYGTPRFVEHQTRIYSSPTAFTTIPETEDGNFKVIEHKDDGVTEKFDAYFDNPYMIITV